MITRRPFQPAPWKGLVAGLAGGVAGTLAMTAAQHALYRVLPQPGQDDEETSASSTEKMAVAIGRRAVGRPLTDRERAWGSSAVHYGFGAAVGAAYGLASEVRPQLARGRGVPFGLGLMLVADDVAVPALGLSEPPHRQPLQTHALSLGAHLVYGLVSETVRRSVRGALV